MLESFQVVVAIVYQSIGEVLELYFGEELDHFLGALYLLVKCTFLVRLLVFEHPAGFHQVFSRNLAIIADLPQRDRLLHWLVRPYTDLVLRGLLFIVGWAGLARRLH